MFTFVALMGGVTCQTISPWQPQNLRGSTASRVKRPLPNFTIIDGDESLTIIIKLQSQLMDIIVAED
jgi:hypothetical protein